MLASKGLTPQSMPGGPRNSDATKDSGSIGACTPPVCPAWQMADGHLTSRAVKVRERTSDVLDQGFVV